jgi:hypothetical protein
LAQAISELHLNGNSPVIVLIGGEIDEKEAEATHRRSTPFPMPKFIKWIPKKCCAIKETMRN